MVTSPWSAADAHPATAARVRLLAPAPITGTAVEFGRILAAYGGVFVAGSLAWAMVVDGFRPDRWDLLGAGICPAGVAVIMWVPRSG